MEDTARDHAKSVFETILAKDAAIAQLTAAVAQHKALLEDAARRERALQRAVAAYHALLRERGGGGSVPQALPPDTSSSSLDDASAGWKRTIYETCVMFHPGPARQGEGQGFAVAADLRDRVRELERTVLAQEALLRRSNVL